MYRRQCMAWLTGSLLGGCVNLPPQPTVMRAITEEEISTLIQKLVIWGWPLATMERTRLVSLYRPVAGGAPTSPNVLRHAQRLATHRNRNVVMPNNDTLYSSAWLRLKGRALLLTLPDVHDRYRSFQLMDAHTDTVSVMHEGTVLLAGPGWSGEVPNGAQLVHTGTDLNWLLGRTAVHGPTDLQAATYSQMLATLRPLEGNPTLPPESVPVDFLPPQDPASPGLVLLDEIVGLSADNPRLINQASWRALLSGLGFTDGHSPAQTIRQRGLQVAAESGVALAAAAVRKRAAQSLAAGAQSPGWVVDGVGVYGDDDLLRAATALRGLGALPPTEALYFSISRSHDGSNLNGSRHVALVMNSDRLKDLGTFWSLSLYDASNFFFVDNAINRYAIGDRTLGLQRETGGVLQIDISHAPPPRGLANWLPAPIGDYVLMFRIYQPRASSQALLELLAVPEVA
ncbi:MAG: DUF1254 domain-containing protein [Rhodoferax sp.]|nr:DUF1254 domain-containing protein [Rhodoferax sp.]